MRSIKSNLFDLSVLGAIVLAFALAWGSPFASAGSATTQDQAQPQQQPNQSQPQQPQPDQAPPQPQPNQAQPQPDQNKAQSATFTGTVVKNGEQFALRDSSGAVYTLDDSQRAKPFEGKTVKVTGQLDEQAKVIHVESIEGVEA
ncbi:MAG: DUF5818 domain-containing protein [Terracidiphilus sp.]